MWSTQLHLEREGVGERLHNFLSLSLPLSRLLRNVMCLPVCRKSVRDDLETQSTKLLQWQTTARCLSDMWDKEYTCVRGREGIVEGDSYASLSLIFPLWSKWKSFSACQTWGRDGVRKKERQRKSRETHTGRQNEREEVKEAVWLTANTPACFLSHTWLPTRLLPPPRLVQASWLDRPRKAAPF